jgi:RNA polymerase sigma-70 factor (ECF subfamily)
LGEAAALPHSEDRSQDEALDALIRQHSRLVYRIAYAALRSHADAEDATQEIFLRVLRYSHKLTAVENHKSWLARIAWRVAVEHSRQRERKREIPLDDPETACPDAPADETMRSSQSSEQMRRFIAALPEKLRNPLILSAVEEMSPRDIAAALGTNEAAVRSLVFRARKILRQKISQHVNRE